MHAACFIWVLFCPCLEEPKFGSVIAEPTSLTSLLFNDGCQAPRGIFILRMFSSRVPCAVHYTLQCSYTEYSLVPDTAGAWGLNSKQESNVWGTIWSFSLELLNLDPGGKRGLLCLLPPELPFSFLCLGSHNFPEENLFLVICPVCLSLCLHSLLFCVPCQSVYSCCLLCVGPFPINVAVLSQSHNAFLPFQLITQQTSVK